jgi:iron complex outermembrane receptor protein
VNTTPRKNFLALLGTGVASAALLSSPAFAQESPKVDCVANPNDVSCANADGSSETAGGSIVVTGSRIARPNLEGASPVTVIGAEQVELTGTTSLETLLNELPQLIPGNTRVSNNSGGENFATLDLRGLGPNRTLILLNGERLPPSSTDGVVDISQIPTGLIQRVDVVTGGASAVYGSDAVAGVVNFILKEDFQGIDLTSQVGIAERGVGFNFNVAGTFGGNFADGKGNITLYASYFKRDAVGQGRFDYSRVSEAIYYDPNGVGDPVAVVDPSKIPAGYLEVGLGGGGSGTNPYGTVVNSAANPFRNLSTLLPAQFSAANTDCNSATPGVPVNGGSLSFNDAGALTPSFNNANTACGVPLRSIGSSRFNFAPLNYLVTPYNRINFSALGKYELSDSTTFRFFGAFTRAEQQVNLAPTPATGIVVPFDSKFIPADLAIALASRPNPTANFTYNRRFLETGPRDGRFKTESFNIRGIVDHDINDNFKISGILSFGEVDNALRGIGNINKAAVFQGLNNCRTTNNLGVLPGCTPINIFGGGTLTPAQLAFVRLDTQQQEHFEQVRAAVNLTGSLITLPAGPVGIALGAEYRKDTAETVVDDAQRTGNIYGFNAVNGIAGSISVKELYGEIRIPIFSMLSVTGGARYSDYSTIGSLFNYKGEVEFTPFSFIKFRGSYNKAARAPNVFELFRNGDQGFVGVSDPCRASNSSRNIPLCIATGVPASAIPGFSAINSQLQVLSFGNPNLSEEKAETYTFGAVLQPQDILGGKLSATVDYYHIKLTNAVQGLGAGFFLSDCYANSNLASCGRIIRDPQNGQVISINTTITNSATPNIYAGIDAGLDFTVPVGPGKFYLSDVFSYTDKFKIGATNFSDTVSAGIGGATFKYGNTLTTGYSTERVTAQVRYIWRKGPKQEFSGADFEGIFPGKNRIPDLNVVNLSVRVKASDTFEITGIVDNLLDKLPPRTISGQQEQANTNISFYDAYALGRTFSVQARVRF